MSEDNKPSQRDFEIAKARLMQPSRDCTLGASGNVCVQIFVPGDPPPSPGSRITHAAGELVEKYVKGFKGRQGNFIRSEELVGFVLSENEAATLRASLRKDRTIADIEEELRAPAPAKQTSKQNYNIEITPQHVVCVAERNGRKQGIFWARNSDTILFTRNGRINPITDALSDELLFQGFNYDGNIGHNPLGNSAERAQTNNKKPITETQFLDTLGLFMQHGVISPQARDAIASGLDPKKHAADGQKQLPATSGESTTPPEQSGLKGWAKRVIGRLGGSNERGSS